MVKAILIDAMSTIFRFGGELTKYENYNRLFFEMFRKNIPVDKIREVFDQKREAIEPKEGRSHLEKWTQINKEILLSIFPEMTGRKAEDLGGLIARKVSSDSSLYEVNRDTKGFLKEARKRGIRIIIASNQDPDCLRGLMKSFKLLKLVDQIYESSRVGLEKPDPRFFQKILKEEKLEPEDCVMIGNNLKNDVLATQKVGLIGVLLDPRKLYPDYEGYRISQFKDLWRLDIFKRS